MSLFYVVAKKMICKLGLFLQTVYTSYVKLLVFQTGGILTFYSKMLDTWHLKTLTVNSTLFFKPWEILLSHHIYGLFSVKLN